MGKVCASSVDFLTQTHQSQLRPVRAAFIWISTNGCSDEQRPRWTVGPRTQRPIEQHIRLIIEFPVLTSRARRLSAPSSSLITFLSSFTSSSPSCGPPVFWLFLAPAFPFSQSCSHDSQILSPPLPGGVFFVACVLRNNHCCLHLLKHNRRLGFSRLSPTPAADAGRPSVGSGMWTLPRTSR